MDGVRAVRILVPVIAIFLIMLPIEASACRLPYRFNPANETFDAMVVAVAVSRRPVADDEQPRPSNENEIMFALDWVAEFETVTTLYGEAPDKITVRQIRLGNGMCWNGIERPEPGGSYAIYLTRGVNGLTARRMIGLQSALELDPVFGRRSTQ